MASPLPACTFLLLAHWLRQPACNSSRHAERKQHGGLRVMLINQPSCTGGGPNASPCMKLRRTGSSKGCTSSSSSPAAKTGMPDHAPRSRHLHGSGAGAWATGLFLAPDIGDSSSHPLQAKRTEATDGLLTQAQIDDLFRNSLVNRVKKPLCCLQVLCKPGHRAP